MEKQKPSQAQTEDGTRLVSAEQLVNLVERVGVARSQILVRGVPEDEDMVFARETRRVELEASTPIVVSPETYLIGIEWDDLKKGQGFAWVVNPDLTYSLGSGSDSKEKPLSQMRVGELKVVKKGLDKFFKAIRA